MTGAVTLAAAAVVGAGAAVYTAIQSGQTQSQARGQSGTIFGEQQQYEQMLNQLIANPSSVTSLPGYQFQQEQGTQAVARQMAASGFLGSGNEATALEQYGQGLASNFYTTQANLLAGLAGITAPSSPSQLLNSSTAAGANSANQWANILQQLGLGVGLSTTGTGITPQESQWLQAGGTSSTIPSGLIPATGGYMQNVPGG
jgi:hypothetical protein